MISLFESKLRISLIVCLSSVVCLFHASIALAQADFDAQAYFRKLDVNGDRRLDVDELNDRASRYLKKLGLPAGRDLRLKDVERALDKTREQADQTSNQAAANRDAQPVPGFGAAADDVESSAGPARFGDGSSASGPVEFSDKTNEMIDYTLKRYDRNRDGSIDSEEMRRGGSWGRPSPQESDANGDGVLSRQELAMRYHVREQQQTGRNKGSESQSRDAESDQNVPPSDRGSRDASDSRRGDRRRSSGESSSEGSSDQKKSGLSEREKYLTYSKSLIARYDTNKDQRLDKKEWKEVRRPPANADRDKDGYVTQSEYADALLGAKGGGSKSSERSRDDSRDDSAGGRIVKTSKGSPSTNLGKLDGNGDAQIEMHEYAKDWNDQKLQEFYKIDLDGDGVITPSEWNNR